MIQSLEKRVAEQSPEQAAPRKPHHYALGMKSGFEGREEELGKSIGIVIKTLQNTVPYPHELNVEKLVTPLASVLASSGRLQDELIDVRRMFEPAVARVAATRVTPAICGDRRIIPQIYNAFRSGAIYRGAL